MSSVVDILYGTEISNRIAKTNLLIVGVGGIGCELLKSLSKSGFKKLTILDLDHIEETNLNRQFYFRKRHVGRSKAEVGKECLNQIDPSIQITAICDSIYSQKYDAAFFSQFDLIVSALDNVAARRHLSGMAIKVGKPVIDAGTEGFSGQAKAVVRYLNDCHNCVPAKSEESFAVCTIRNSPERPVHCVAYAKSLYDGIFGDDSSNPLVEEINPKSFVVGEFTDEQIKQAAIKLFNILFYQKISNKLYNSFGGSALIHPLLYEEAIKSKNVLVNPPSTSNQIKVKKQKASIHKEEQLRSLADLAEMFVQSFFTIVKTQKQSIGHLKFEKDDRSCMEFVYAVTSLRTYNFMNRTNNHNKHQYLTFFDCKDVAGKIVPAISSTNSIAASIQTSDIFRILEGKLKDLKYVTFKTFVNPRISALENAEPSSQCPVCSCRCVYLRLFCDFSQTTYSQLQGYLQDNFSYKRNPFVRNKEGIHYAIQFQEDQPKDVLLSSFQSIIVVNEGMAGDGAFELNYYSNNTTPVNLSVYIINRPGVEGIVADEGSLRDPNAKNILRHLRINMKDELEDSQYAFNKHGYI